MCLPHLGSEELSPVIQHISSFGFVFRVRTFAISMTLTGLLDAKLVDYVQLNPVEYLKLISRHKVVVETFIALGLTPHLTFKFAWDSWSMRADPNTRQLTPNHSLPVRILIG